MFRRTSSVLAAAAIAVGGLAGVAVPAIAAVSDASISPTQWNVGSTSAVTVTWTESAVPTTIMVRSPWPWPANYPAGTTGAPGTETAVLDSTTSIRCAGTGIVFSSPQFNATAAPTCKYVNTPNSYWTGFYLDGGTLGMTLAPTITVTIPSGLVFAPSTAQTDTWIVGPYSLNWSPTTQVEVATTAVATGGAGIFVPLVTLNIDANGGTCNVSSVTGYQSTWASAPEASSCIKPGVFFTGFNTSPDGSGIAVSPGGNLHLTGDNTLYAVYAAPQTAAAPTDVVAVAGRNQIKVSWKAPANTGSLPITNYLVQASPSGRVCITRTSDADMLSCTMNLSATNTTYSFKVQALNGAGWGEMSTASNAVSPFNLVLNSASRPKANFFQRLAGWGSIIEMSGRAPGFAVGTAVIPQWKVGSGNWVSESRSGVKVGSNHQVSWSKKLKKNLNGEAVTVRFVSGDVASDEAALKVGSQAGLASAPRNVRFVVTEAKSAPGRELNVTWQPPANDGGSPITSYAVSAQLSEGSLPITCRVDASKPLVCRLFVNPKALSPDKKYPVTVTAISARGEGKPAKVTLSRPS